MEGEDTPNRAYWAHYRDDLNSLHPSCSGISAASATTTTTQTPEETAMETEEVRTVTYREGRGAGQADRADGGARRDRDRRRGDRRGDRHRDMREQERERGAARRQRDRGDRAFRARGPPRK